MFISFKYIVKIKHMRFTENFQGFLFETVVLLRFYNWLSFFFSRSDLIDMLTEKQDTGDMKRDNAGFPVRRCGNKSQLSRLSDFSCKEIQILSDLCMQQFVVQYSAMKILIPLQIPVQHD